MLSPLHAWTSLESGTHQSSYYREFSRGGPPSLTPLPLSNSLTREEAWASTCFSLCLIFNAFIFSLFLWPVEDSTGNPAAMGSRKAQVADCVTYVNRDVIYTGFFKKQL